jgi:hypothetical protein
MRNLCKAATAGSIVETEANLQVEAVQNFVLGTPERGKPEEGIALLNLGHDQRNKERQRADNDPRS